MDVSQTALKAFKDVLQESKVSVSEIEMSRIQQQYNYRAVQEFIDSDIDRARRTAPFQDRDRVSREREEYHKQNVVNIASAIARRVIIEKRERPYQIVNESKAAEFRGYVKTAGARGCDVYPC